MSRNPLDIPPVPQDATLISRAVEVVKGLDSC
jgi:hypothetical protein